MSIYVPDPANNPTSFTLPDQGEPPADATNKLNAVLEGLADGIAWVRSRVIGTGANDFHRFLFSVMPQADPDWVFGATAVGALGLYQAVAPTSGGGPALWLELEQPKKAVLKDISVTIRPLGGHGSLPTGMPSFELYSQTNASDSVPTLVGTVTDTSLTTGAYQTAHALSLTGLSAPFDPSGNLRYFARVEGEAGPNELAGLVLLSIHGHFDPAP